MLKYIEYFFRILANINMDKTYIDKLGFIEIKDRKILLTATYGKDKWYMPGGKREEGETDQQALIREAKEELTVDLIPETIEYYGTFEAQAHGKPEGTVVRVTCYSADFEGEIAPSNEIEKITWLDYSRREEVSLVGQIIIDDLKQKDLIE